MPDEEKALLARAQTGKIILTKASRFVVDKMQNMIAASEAGKH